MHLKSRPSKSLFVSILVLISVISGCTTFYNPATGKKETLLIGTEQEVSLGMNMDRQLRQEFKILDDPAMQERLDSIGKRIAAVSDRQDLNYRFSIIQDRELNAFAIPGGYIYVNSGLIQVATDDELACVLAHEVGHVAARHSVKKIQSVMGYQILLNLALGLGAKEEMAQAAQIAFQVTSLGYSRKDELLADKISVRYSRGAGFNPRGMISFFDKLKEEEGKRGPNLKIEFLSSHPDLDLRIKQVDEEISAGR